MPPPNGTVKFVSLFDVQQQRQGRGNALPERTRKGQSPRPTLAAFSTQEGNRPFYGCPGQTLSMASTVQNRWFGCFAPSSFLLPSSLRVFWLAAATPGDTLTGLGSGSSQAKKVKARTSTKNFGSGPARDGLFGG